MLTYKRDFQDFWQLMHPPLRGDWKSQEASIQDYLLFFPLFSLETCRDVLCPGSSTCVVDQTNNAYCVTCNRVCAEVTSPDQYLCGNDGIVYASACHLRRATCLQGKSIGVAYEGKCISE